MKDYLTIKLAATVGGLLLALLPVQATDYDYVENAGFDTTVAVAFNNSAAATVTVLSGAGSGVTYAQSDAGLVITSAVAGVEFIVSGASTGNSLKLVADQPVKLTLNSLQLASTNGPAISVQGTNRCFVVLADGTVNTLTDSSTYTQSGEGVLSSTGPLIFSGRGSVSLAGKKKHGIYSAAYVRLLGGDVTVAAAPKDGIHAVQFFQQDQGTLDLTATGDGVDADTGYVLINGGAINILTPADDVKGIKCDGTLTINGGVINLTVNGIQSKALKSTGNMAINGGTLLFNLAGAMDLTKVSSYATNAGTITTNTYVDPSYSTAIKCDGNLTVTAGTITITHTGTAGQGISVDGNISILGGSLDIATSGGCSASFTNSERVLDVAAADCLKADGNLQILGGTINCVSSGNAGDCISADGYAILGVSGITNTPRLNLATRGQKVLVSGSGQNADYANPKTFKAAGDLTVNGGVFLASTKNDGGEGLESKGRLTINGGTLEITAYDDCINATTNITINGGNIYCYSSGNDAIDSNGTMQINGGTIIASGTTAPEEGFDCDQNNFAIKGGIMVGTGGASSTPTSASCTQRSVMYTAAGTAGTIIQVKSAAGNNLVYKIPRSYSGTSGMLLLFSNSGLTAGTTYTIVSGGTVSGGTEFHGFYTGATVTGGTTNKTFTVSSSAMVNTVK